MIDVAVLLCAGSSMRLRPLTDDRPKCLIDVGGETILGRAERLLVSAGVREIIVATGYREEAVRAALAVSRAKVTFCHNPDFARTQNAVSLHACAREVAQRAFFKLDGDVLFDEEILPRLLREKAPLSVAIERRDDLGDEEMKVITEGAEIRSFGKHLDPARSAGESIGIEAVSEGASALLFEALADAVRTSRTDLYYEDVYGELVARGLSARAVDVSDLAWIEIDTADDLARARRWMTGGRLTRSA